MIKDKKYLFFWLIVYIAAILIHPYIQYQIDLYVPYLTALILIVLFFSVVLHELGHGLAAALCGDDTALKAGRLTLNPVKHISLFGTILLPVFLNLIHAQIILGWAKPVPFNSVQLKKYPRDQVIVAAAGPVTNLLLAYIFFNGYIVSALVFQKIHPEITVDFAENIFNPLVQNPALFSSSFWFVSLSLLSTGIFINVLLAIFNLIPVPPLDGFWLLKTSLPGKLRIKLGSFHMIGIVIFFLLIYFKLIEYFVYPVTILQSGLRSLTRLILG